MAWQIVVLLVLLLAFAIAIGAGTIEKLRRAVEFRREDRTMRWEDALLRIRAGHGVIVENITSLPGRLWWIENSEAIEQDDLYEEIETRGLYVIDAPSRTIIEQTVLTGGLFLRYRRLDSEPFSD